MMKNQGLWPLSKTEKLSILFFPTTPITKNNQRTYLETLFKGTATDVCFYVHRNDGKINIDRASSVKYCALLSG